MDPETGLIVTYPDWQNIDESEYVGVIPKGPIVKLKMSYKSLIRRVKPSWSTNDLSSAYGNALTASPKRPWQEPLKNVDEHMYLSRLNGRPSVSEGRHSLASLPALSLEEKCRHFLDEKLSEQLQQQKVLFPKACYIYGDMAKQEIPFDSSKEAYADYSVCVTSAQEQITFQAERLRWEEDKARGVHFPSVLKVRRKELSTAIQKATKANVKIIPKPFPPSPFRVPRRRKCKNCATAGHAVPPVLKSSDWLPLVYLDRSGHCENQRPDLEKSMWAHEAIINRIILENTPGLSVWTCRRSRRRCLGPSPLSQSIVPGAHLDDSSSASVVETESSSQHDVDDETEAQSLASDSSDSSNSPSVFSLDPPETDMTHEDAEPEPDSTDTYRAIEVRGLHWVKKYRVPTFMSTNKEHHRSMIAEVVPVEDKPVKINTASPQQKKQYNFDKPLPPLPLFATSDSPGGDRARRRALRRSRSEHIGILGGQRLKPALVQITPHY